ncbi:MAG: DUF3098 domain-containing protein [Bacteroidetes bacterium]|nr:DUF3098 domain-containing protein [Bacteroidota bacterium]
MAKKETKLVNDFAFGRENYMWMLIGIACIFVGFILMSGGGSKDPNVFNPDIFSFRRITLAPVVVLIGFVIEIYAILKKTKE